MTVRTLPQRFETIGGFPLQSVSGGISLVDLIAASPDVTATTHYDFVILQAVGGDLALNFNGGNGSEQDPEVETHLVISAGTTYDLYRKNWSKINVGEYDGSGGQACGEIGVV